MTSSTGPSASVALTDLVDYCAQLLEVGAIEDYGPNGLQVEGRPRIGLLVTGVSACAELFRRAIELSADAVVVHHGVLWDFLPTQPLVGFHGRRIRALLAADLSLLAYHLPLDRHAELGNNALAARALGLAELLPFGDHHGSSVGFRGRFASPVPIAEFVGRCATVFDRKPLHHPGGPDLVSTVGIVSGGAQKEFYQAISLGLDAYVTGEVSEWVQNVAAESRTHYLSCGHYATERLGIRALGEHLAERFGIRAIFVDVPNPV